MIQKKNEEYKDGYDMNTFTINGTRLAKVIGQYSHVFMTDRALVSKFAQSFNIPEANADGCICIFWPAHTQKHFTLFTRRMILESQFDFNRFAFHTGTALSYGCRTDRNNLRTIKRKSRD